MNRTVRILLGLLTIGLVALTSCKKDNQEPKKNEGSTYANVSISVQSDMRAGGDDEKEHNYVGQWNGRDAIKSITVYIVDNATISSGDYNDPSKFNITKAAADGSTNISITPNEAIKTTPGEKSVYVLINADAKIKSYLDAAETPFAFKKAYAAAVEVITAQEAAKTELNGTDPEDVIMMTNAKECTLKVKDGVTKDQAEAAQNPENRASVEVKRAVARVLLTTTAEEYTVNFKDGKKMGTIKNITYAVAQGEKSLYLTQMTELVDTKNIIKTPAYDFLPAKDTEHPEKLTLASYQGMYKYYDYSDLKSTVTTPRKAAVATDLTTALKIGAQSLTQSAFMFEASHKFGDVDNTGFRRANTPYVLVRTTFVPAKFEDGDAATYTEGTTFYRGENGRFYLNKDNVINEEKGGVKGQKFYTYENGKALYYAFVNPDVIKQTVNAPAYRNNIYHISVKGFLTIGTNWNPFFPEDPDDPGKIGGGTPGKPNNPDPRPEGEVLPPPITPGETNTPKETYMAVDVTVIPWNVHTYEIDLTI